MAKKQLPPKLYAYWQHPGDDDPYLLAAETPDKIDVVEDEIEVGVYELVARRRAVNKTEIVD